MAELGRCAGEADLVAFDVGGTSTDVSLVAGGRPGFARERVVAGYPLRSPTIDVQVIGAGGGSLAWIDAGGALRVGPRSAGAEPGPAAYGRGGTEPTLTDAHVVLGRLNPGALLGGRLPLDAAAAARAVGAIAGVIGTAREAAAEGIVRVAVASIARAIRSVSTERGHDPRRFALVAYGGAGPVLAAAVAREVGCARVLVPEAPGAMCARGILAADPSTDYVRSAVVPADPGSWDGVRARFRDLAAEAGRWLERERIPEARRCLRCTIDARYAGQGFEIEVEATGEAGEVVDREAFLTRFAAAHAAHYGYALPERGVEVVNCRLQAVGRLAVSAVPPVPGEAAPPPPAPAARPVFFGADHGGWRETPVLDRAHVPAGAERLAGPAVIEELTSTTLLFPGDRLHRHPAGHLVMEVAS